jgi:molybdate transport system permease protein
MDGRAAEPLGGHDCDLGQPAVRDRNCHGAGAGALLGPDAPQRARAAAADPPAGRDRLHPADHLGIVLSFRWTGAALACGIMGFPLMVRAIRLSVEAVDKKLEEAAGTLGANRVWVFLTVTLPLIVPGIIAGMILCFAKAMGEFGATITFVSNIPGETQTLPSAIYTFTQVPGGDAGAFRLTLVSIAIAMLALLASELMARHANRRLDIE